jgi:acyl-CoA synthetase (AMP-forming)/AMP-acid ligase II
LNDEAATREKVRDGWLHTGDLGKVDEEGHVYVLGRLKAMIKRGAAQIAPREIEEATERVAGVSASAAIGVDRGSESESVVVVAEVGEAAASGDGGERLVEAISSAVSKAVGFAPSEILLAGPGGIPRTALGKIAYAELRRLVIDGTLQTVGQPPST